MPILVDGDNLLGTSGLKRSAASRRELAMTLARLGVRDRKRVVTVFDGTDPGAPAFGANVHFAGGARSADDLILSMLRDVPDKRGWVVITSDRSLGDQCRWLGARVEPCHRFRERLTSSKHGEKPEREENIDFWLKEFGVEDDQAD
jgi:hypothetical protein